MSDEILLQLAQQAPATVVLALVAWRLDQRMAALSAVIERTLAGLASAAMRDRE